MAALEGTLTWPRVQPAQLLRELKRSPYVSLSIIGLFVASAVLAGLIAPHDPMAQDLRARLLPPIWERAGSPVHLLGTDHLGRDTLSRLIHGARISLVVALGGLFVSAVIGTTVGLVAGYLGGKVDAVLMRLVDASIALPGLLFALIFAVTLGASYMTVIIAIGVVSWARYARMMRAEALMIKTRDYVRAARVAGSSDLRVLWEHVLPNSLNTLLVLTTLSIGGVILFEASLSFLGAGIPPPAPSWGSMTAQARDYLTTHPWYALLPGSAITLVVFAFNFFGDWIRDRLDPRLRQL